MCGVAGFFGAVQGEEIAKSIKEMLASMSHRGPDGSGMKIFDQGGLGHVRLAIIDIDGGGQPMSTDDGMIHISYNGEVYNFRELREKLVGLGYSFNTKSDTEVILRAYCHYGIEAFSLLRGMFAIALWDEVKKEGVLARDRYGIKPLFYSICNHRVVFASEIKAIMAVKPQLPQLAMQSLHLLMNFRYIPGEATMFEDVFHLPPGHYLRWKGGDVSICRWASSERRCRGHHNLIAQVRESLQQGVEKQLVSDVPLGAYLSGGIDSATIVALSSGPVSQTSGGFPTFTIQTGDSPFEARNAAESAKLFEVQNFQESVQVDLQKMLPWMIWHLEVPKVNAVQSALVARLAKKHVKVALSGLGADEIFLGYNLHKIIANVDLVNSFFPQIVLRTSGRVLASLFDKFGMRWEELKRGGQLLDTLPDFSRIYGILRNVWDSPSSRKRIYGPRLLEVELQDSFEFLHEKWPEGDDPLISVQEFEVENKMVNDLLLQEDRLSMAFGLEVRVPFLDEDLGALMAGVSPQHKIPGRNLKKMMRDVVAPWVPWSILQRPKSGFQVPIHLFFNKQLRPLVAQYLSRKRLLEDGLFNPDFVESVLSARPHYRLRWHYFMLYLMICVTIWLDIFIRGGKVKQWN